MLERRWQGVVRSEHVGKIGIASATPGNFQRVENGGLGWHIDIGHVRMPYRLTSAEIADRLTVLDDVGDDVYFRKLRVERLPIRVRSGWIELAKLSAEVEELRVSSPLPTRNDDQSRL